MSTTTAVPSGVSDAELSYNIVGFTTLIICAVFLLLSVVGVPLLVRRCRPSQPVFPLYGACQRRKEHVDAGDAGADMRVSERLRLLLSEAEKEKSGEAQMQV